MGGTRKEKAGNLRADGMYCIKFIIYYYSTTTVAVKKLCAQQASMSQTKHFCFKLENKCKVVDNLAVSLFIYL